MDIKYNPKILQKEVNRLYNLKQAHQNHYLLQYI